MPFYIDITAWFANKTEKEATRKVDKILESISGDITKLARENQNPNFARNVSLGIQEAMKTVYVASSQDEKHPKQFLEYVYV